jgi:hypothetical protein
MAAKTKKKDELCLPGDKQRCAAMKMALENSGKQGLHVTFLLAKNRVDTCLAYKPPGRGAKLIILNYCPWCGRNIKPPKQDIKFKK